tara:strand:+ start:1121 stop:1756 length:636 start_codon:yes stop_codon:yes gene_type:complete
MSAEPTSNQSDRPVLEQMVFDGRHMVLHDADWDDYDRFTNRFEQLGYGRVSYCDDILEIVRSSDSQAKIRRILGRLVEDYSIRLSMDFERRSLSKIGFQHAKACKVADEAFWFGKNPDMGERPDLVLEVVPSKAIYYDNFYARFRVPELWIWEYNQLSVYLLNDEETDYETSEESEIFPQLNITLVEYCAQLPSVTRAIREFRQGLKTTSV